MVSVFDVAQYILSKKEPMSTWKLQKLCYYSQAWHYTWTEKPLFSESFEAWANGPVCPILFYEHQGIFMITKKDLSKGDESLLSDDEKESIDIIVKDYGELAPYDLRELTHNEDPWKKARGALPEGARCNVVITLESMGEYYGQL